MLSMGEQIRTGAWSPQSPGAAMPAEVQEMLDYAGTVLADLTSDPKGLPPHEKLHPEPRERPRAGQRTAPQTGRPRGPTPGWRRHAAARSE